MNEFEGEVRWKAVPVFFDNLYDLSFRKYVGLRKTVVTTSQRHLEITKNIIFKEKPFYKFYIELDTFSVLFFVIEPSSMYWLIAISFNCCAELFMFQCREWVSRVMHLQNTKWAHFITFDWNQFAFCWILLLLSFFKQLKKIF